MSDETKWPPGPWRVDDDFYAAVAAIRAEADTLRAEVARLTEALGVEREWVQALTKDSGAQIAMLDGVASAIGIKNRNDYTPLPALVREHVERLTAERDEASMPVWACRDCGAVGRDFHAERDDREGDCDCICGACGSASTDEAGVALPRIVRALDEAQAERDTLTAERDALRADESVRRGAALTAITALEHLRLAIPDRVTGVVVDRALAALRAALAVTR